MNFVHSIFKGDKIYQWLEQLFINLCTQHNFSIILFYLKWSYLGRGNADRFEGALLIYCIFKRVVIFKGGQIMLKNIDAVNIVPISAFEHDEVTCAKCKFANKLV